MQIAAFDEDTSKITWLCKDIYENHVMNSTGTTSGGWPATEMRTYLTEEIYNNIASSVKSRIVQVSKTYYDYSTSSTKTSDDYVWIPSYREVNFGTDRENSGIVYSGLFTDSGTGSSTARVKNYNGSAHGWWLRSANSSRNFYNVNNNGSNNNNNNVNNTNGVVFGSSSARQSKHSAEIGAVGEKESITHVRRTSVNICHDKPGRTLLAWRRLMVNPSFHAHWFYAPDATIHSGVRGIPYIYMTSKERHEGQVQR